MALHPFHVADIELPQDSSGFVYILVSVKNRQSTYIGQTNNLVRRLKEHNSGIGALSTASELLCPWALLAYVAGFDGTSRTRMAFETAWKRKRDSMLSLDGSLCPEDIAKLALPLIESKAAEDLRFVMCSFPSKHPVLLE